MSLSITSFAYYLPEKIVTNDDLLALVRHNGGPGVDIDGLKKKLLLNKAETRHFKQPHESGLEMAVAASKKCLQKANFLAEDLDLILYAGMLRDYIEPAMGIAIQEILGAGKANAFDISNACNGFLNGIEISYLYMKANKYRNILIVGAEDGSERIPWHLFNSEESFSGFSALTISDGAAAMLLQNEGGAAKNFGIFDFKTFSQYNDICRIKIGKEVNDLKLMVNSKQLAKVALDIMSDFIPAFLNKAENYLGKIDIWFLHQVTGDSRRFCGNLSKELFEKTYNSFSKVGNTGSISIPLGMALAEEEGRLKRGDHVAVVVGASGFSCGGTVFVY